MQCIFQDISGGALACLMNSHIKHHNLNTQLSFPLVFGLHKDHHYQIHHQASVYEHKG